MSLDGLLWYGGAFALALGILIVFHELGHYTVARWCGVKVLRFSVGFGKIVVSRPWGKDGTEWSLSAFPLGGYVKMLDEREGPVADGDLPRAFNRQALPKRALIVAAGPVANLLLAIFLYWGVYLLGGEELRPVLAAPAAGTIVARAGLAERDTVESVAGKAIATMQELRWELVRQAVSRTPTVLEVVDAQGLHRDRVLDFSDLPASAIDGDLLKELGIKPFWPPLKPIVGRVLGDSPAERAGVKVGDEIVAIDERPIPDWNELEATIRHAAGRQLAIDILRAGDTLRLEVVPATANDDAGRPVGRIGIAARGDPALHAQMVVTVRLDPVSAMRRAVGQTWDTAVFSLQMIGRMIAGNVSWKNVSGPVTIADYAGQSARMGGVHYLKFLALISISLGVLNLLPIPILDGGHLMYYLAEFIKGGPLSDRIMETGQQIGLALLMALMVFAFYNDINRILAG